MRTWILLGLLVVAGAPKLQAAKSWGFSSQSVATAARKVRHPGELALEVAIAERLKRAIVSIDLASSSTARSRRPRAVTTIEVVRATGAIELYSLKDPTRGDPLAGSLGTLRDDNGDLLTFKFAPGDIVRVHVELFNMKPLKKNETVYATLWVLGSAARKTTIEPLTALQKGRLEAKDDLAWLYRSVVSTGTVKLKKHPRNALADFVVTNAQTMRRVCISYAGTTVRNGGDVRARVEILKTDGGSEKITLKAVADSVSSYGSACEPVKLKVRPGDHVLTTFKFARFEKSAGLAAVTTLYAD